MDSLKKMAGSISSSGGHGGHGGVQTLNGMPVTDRMMKYPYTMTAKVRQFPYQFYFNNSWFYRYWIYGIVCSVPIFWWIQTKARSPENIAKWKEIRRKEKEAAREAAKH